MEQKPPAVLGPVESSVRPRAWIGPSGQTMPDEIYAAWAQRYPDDAKHFAPLYDQAALDAAVAAERERWERPAFLWPAAMPDEVACWVSANVPQVVPRDEMQRVEWPNAGAKLETTAAPK